MAVLVLYAQPSRRPGDPRNYDEGDVVDVLEDGQHPGWKTVSSGKFAFVKVPGTRDEWLHLKEEFHIWEFDPDGIPNNVEMVFRRKKKLTVLEDAATKADAVVWAKTPTMTKAVVDAATADKSRLVVK